MSVGIFRAAVALAANQRQMETISSNLANLATHGFKRDTNAAHRFELGGPRGKRHGLATVNQVDFSQGDLARTGRQLDLALFGEGFFALEGPEGEVYTRNGQLFLTPEGGLVSDSGYPVAWETFRVPIDPAGIPIEIDSEGVVRQGLLEVGYLKVVNFEDPQRLYQDGNGYWLAPNDLRETNHTARVHQGALEGSNATGVEEMVAMVSVQRSYETTARLISSIADSYSRLTRPF